MRDLGLDEAIRAAGGVGALARKIGISQPSVSNWSRVPAERVLSVEAATGVNRATLRPDLYAEHAGTAGDIDEVDAARAQEYALLSVLLARAPDAALLAAPRHIARRCEPARARARRACGGGGAAPASSASSANISISSSGSAAASFCPTARIISPGSCMSGRWRGCARISSRLGIERAEGQAEPEDHAAILCEIMAGLGEPALSRSRRRRPRAVRAASRALDRALLRRSGTRRGRRFLSANRNARPGVHGDRDARPSRCPREQRDDRDGSTARRRGGGDGDETRTQSNARPS